MNRVHPLLPIWNAVWSEDASCQWSTGKPLNGSITCDRTLNQPLQPLFLTFCFSVSSTGGLPALPAPSLEPPQPLPAAGVTGGAVPSAGFTSWVLPAPDCPPQPLPAAGFLTSVPPALGFAPQPLPEAMAPGIAMLPELSRPAIPSPANIFFIFFFINPPQKGLCGGPVHVPPRLLATLMANPLDEAYPVHRQSQSIGNSDDILFFHGNILYMRRFEANQTIPY